MGRLTSRIDTGDCVELYYNPIDPLASDEDN
jgi:hypothetical protein